jgi:hypothetical protein
MTNDWNEWQPKSNISYQTSGIAQADVRFSSVKLKLIVRITLEYATDRLSDSLEGLYEQSQ